MPTVTVWCKGPDGPDPTPIDLKQTRSVQLAEDSWLHVYRGPEESVWFVAHHEPYKRRRDIEAEKLDSRVYAERSDGQISPFAREAWELSRKYVGISEE